MLHLLATPKTGYREHKNLPPDRHWCKKYSGQKKQGGEIVLHKAGSPLTYRPPKELMAKIYRTAPQLPATTNAAVASYQQQYRNTHFAARK